MPVEEFIRRNADPIWLHENGEWDLLESDASEGATSFDEENLPF
jgi:hypothetical protein